LLPKGTMALTNALSHPWLLESRYEVLALDTNFGDLLLACGSVLRAMLD